MPQTLLRSEDLHGWVNGTLGELSLAAGCGTDQYSVDPILHYIGFIWHTPKTHTHTPTLPALPASTEHRARDAILGNAIEIHNVSTQKMFNDNLYCRLPFNWKIIYLCQLYQHRPCGYLYFGYFFWCSSLEKTNKHCDMWRPTESETPLVEKGKCASRHQFKKKWVKTKTNLMAWQEFNLSICCALPICQSWLTTPIGRNLVLGLGDVFLFSHKCDLGYSKIFKKTHRNSHKASQSMFFPFGVLKNPLYRIHIHIYNIYSWVEPPHSRKKCGDSTQICLSTGTWNSF